HVVLLRDRGAPAGLVGVVPDAGDVGGERCRARGGRCEHENGGEPSQELDHVEALERKTIMIISRPGTVKDARPPFSDMTDSWPGCVRYRTDPGPPLRYAGNRPPRMPRKAWRGHI